jgi:heptosyltransferase III
MSQKVAIFCHNGLGDGIVALVLSHNLHLNGFQVDTYQNLLGNLQNWFPHLPILPYPPMHQIEDLFSRYDLLCVFQDTASPFIQKLISEGKSRYPERVKVLYIYPSAHIVHEPYYQDARVDPSRPIAENMWRFCEQMLQLSKISRTNGIVPPLGLRHRLHRNRIFIHSTSSRPGKNWQKQKFEALALHLETRGYHVIWAHDHEQSLHHLASAIYESGFFIGNDSGPGHLASALGIPTVTIARRKSYCNFYAPCFTEGSLVTPGSWIPNLGGFRLRDRYWKHFISVRKVLRSFEKLCRNFA